MDHGIAHRCPARIRCIAVSKEQDGETSDAENKHWIQRQNERGLDQITARFLLDQFGRESTPGVRLGAGSLIGTLLGETLNAIGIAG